MVFLPTYLQSSDPTCSISHSHRPQRWKDMTLLTCTCRRDHSHSYYLQGVKSCPSLEFITQSKLTNRHRVMMNISIIAACMPALFAIVSTLNSGLMNAQYPDPLGAQGTELGRATKGALGQVTNAGSSCSVSTASGAKSMGSTRRLTEDGHSGRALWM